MGKFSSNAASALDKLLKRRTLIRIGQMVDYLKKEIQQKGMETSSIEQEAGNILTPKYNVGGDEIYNYQPEGYNLVQGLDEDDLVRALGVAVSVRNLIAAERAAWLADNKKQWEAGTRTKHLRYVEDVTHGPGIIPPPVGRKV